MMNLRIAPTLKTALGLVILAGSVTADDQHPINWFAPEPHLQAPSNAAVPPLGLSLTEGWLDPWPHSHFSANGTAFVHGFGVEPAYLDRDLFFDFALIGAEGEREIETEIELEWALTRRLGFVLEVPYIRRNPDSGFTESGFGDVALAPRALIYEGEQMLLSMNLEVGLPTGDEHKGFGGDEVGLAPSVSTWLDLGRRLTLQTQAGFETGAESGESGIFYSAALIHTILTPDASGPDGIHFPSGMVNLISEFTGRTGVHGDEDGETTGELLFGASYLLTSNWEIRGAYQIPIVGETEVNDSFIIGVIYHF